MINILRNWIAAVFFSLWAITASSAPLKVDLSMPNRPDAMDPHYTVWDINEAPSVSRNFGDVTVTFSKLSGGATVKADWYKGGIDYPALMATDGLIGVAGGTVQMTIDGLSAGNHTLATYHNTFSNPATNTFSKLNITLNGAPYVTGFVTTNRVLNNYDAPSIYYPLTVSAGQTVTLTFTGDGSGSNNDVVINGFEIDMVDPKKKAIKPVPDNDDEHADADDGDLQLSWTAAVGAVSHDLYFGGTFNAVDNANSGSPEFKGNQSAIGYTVAGLNNYAEYFWRVDEVDNLSARTKGEVWRFRIRHLAFPSAEGWGRFARGGRGGVVYEVTNLNDSGPGSLREGIENMSVPRTIVFNISGRIVLQSKLVLREDYCTVAGQTAPGDGICISNYNFGMLGEKDGIIRYIRVRPGNTASITLDGMGMASSDHSIIDHCSVSWSIDEVFSSRGARYITLQRSMITEALNDANHQNYPPGTQHGYAASIGGNIGSFHHNLLAHCAGRNWSLAGGLNNAGQYAGNLDIRQNVVYNWRSRTTDGGAAQVNFVNNYYKRGPAKTQNLMLNPQFDFDTNVNPVSLQRYYISGNVTPGVWNGSNPQDGVASSPSKPFNYYYVATPFFASYVTPRTATDAYTNVMANVGCNRPQQDSVDARIIQETLNGTFTYSGSRTGLPGLPDSQDDVGGWPVYPVVSRAAGYDTDHDGMPDYWENQRAYLDANDSNDRNEDFDNDGYTNLEDFLNFLAGDIGPTELTPVGISAWEFN